MGIDPEKFEAELRTDGVEKILNEFQTSFEGKKVTPPVILTCFDILRSFWPSIDWIISRVSLTDFVHSSSTLR